MPDGPVTNCGSCGHGGLEPVLDLGIQPLPQAIPGKVNPSYPLRLVECPHCTLVQLDYIAPQAELFPPDYPYATGNTRSLREHFRGQARTISSIISPADLVIDIGGNDGTMLKALRPMAPDARLMLIEPTDQARKAGPGITVVQDYFTSILAASVRRGHGRARVITASNVFGHVPDPRDFLAGAEFLLADNGVLIIDNQDWYNVVNLLQVDTIYHEHLRYWSPASLTWLLAMHGFYVTSLTRTGMHGGAFRAIACREKANLRMRARLLASTLRRLLEDVVQDGPVYAIAAPTRATPLVNYAGIGDFLTCACEVPGSEKIGAVIPGTQVPVVDEAKLYADQPPHALLLAWDLAGSLVPVLRSNGYEGKIIVPLPEPRILDD